MHGACLRRCRKLQKIFLLNAVRRLNGRNGERAGRDRTGLIENHGIRLCERLQIFAALNEHAVFGCHTDTGKKAERNGNVLLGFLLAIFMEENQAVYLIKIDFEF